MMSSLQATAESINRLLACIRPRHFALLLILVGLPLLTSCGDHLKWYVVSPETKAGRVNLMFLMGGIKYTLLLSIVAICISFVLGLLVALPGLSERRSLRIFNRVYVELFRSIPLLVGIFWVHLGLPILTGVTLSPFWSAVIALSVLDSAFEAEIFRGGIQSIDRGQLEAADSIGLGYIDRMRFVILPQAIRRMLPPMGNQFVYMLKMSSLASVIGVQELLRRANELTTVEYRALEIYSFLVVEYLVLILLVSTGVRYMERRLARQDQR